MNVIYRIRIFIGFVITSATRRVPHVEQDLFTLQENLRSSPAFGGVRVAYSLVLYVVSCELLFVGFPFLFLSMALSVYFQFMSLTVPLVQMYLSSLFYIHLDTLPLLWISFAVSFFLISVMF